MEGQGRIDRGCEIVLRDKEGQVVDRWHPIRRLREAIAGDERAGLDFPLDLLVSHGLLSQEMCEEGLRFTALAWWLYGMPAASCKALYERMVAEGIGQDFAPRPEGPETDDERLKRIASQKARFERMTRALVAPPSRLVTVRRICQFLERPSLIERLAKKESASARDLQELAHLSEGLHRLVALREAEDRYRGDLARRAIKRPSISP